jgi:taurine dioxygenase
VNVYHPLVLPHPATGRRALYGVSGSSFGIVGMAEPEAVALLDDLKRHATQERYRHAHRYEAGDLVIWDNWATLHAASLIEPATGPADTRLLHRISVKGMPTFDRA